MGETTAETMKDIDRTRERLGSELRELESYLPAGIVWAKRAVGALVAGGVATSALLFVVRRLPRKDAKDRLRHLERRLDRLERDVVRY
jgi:hypothetical protein